MHRPTPALPDVDLVRTLERLEAKVWAGFHTLATEDEAAQAGLRLSTTPAGTLLAASRLDVLFFNRVVDVGTSTPLTPERLEALLAECGALAGPRCFVQVSPAAQPHDLAAWLSIRGLPVYNRWAKLTRGVAPPPPTPTDLRIERAGPEHATVFGELLAPAFDWPAPMARLLARLLHQPGWRGYLAFDGKVPVAAAGLHVAGSLGYLGPAATHPAYRRRGAQRALIACRIREAAALGCTLLVTETAEDRPGRPAMSFRNLQHMGFELAYLRPNYLLTPPS